MNLNRHGLKKLLLPLSVVSLAVLLAPLEAQAKETKNIEASAPAIVQQSDPEAPSTATLEISDSPSQSLPPEITTSSESIGQTPSEVTEVPAFDEAEYHQTPIAPEVASARDTVPAFTPKATSDNSVSQSIEPQSTDSEPVVANDLPRSTETSLAVTTAPDRSKSKTPKVVARNTSQAQRAQSDAEILGTYEVSQTTPGAIEENNQQLTVPGTTAPRTAPDTTTPTDTPNNSAQYPNISPGRATRSGPSYIGVGGSIGLGGGDTALGEGNFAVFSKIGLLRTVSVRPAVLFDGDATILLPITYDFPIGTDPTDELGFRAAPYLGIGPAISTGDDTSVDLLLTGGLDIPLSSRFTLNGAVNATVTGDPSVGIQVGVGLNF